ncbi:MAG: BglII/BstYI family type II restriction endonuclease, partial [Brevundimonas sp.]
MSNLRFVPQELQDLYEVHEWRNGLAVLAAARPDEWEDIKAALSEFRLYASEIIKKGGNRSAIAIRLDSLLEQRNWSEQGFDTFIRVGDEERKSPTHKVDMYKNRVAFETEWNNKDPFYDRDLNNFRLLFDLRVIDVGVIVTRCDELQQLVVELGRDKGSYGNSTTHMSKLLPRLEGGGG